LVGGRAGRRGNGDGGADRTLARVILALPWRRQAKLLMGTVGSAEARATGA
jgi:hypothetical protein